MDRAPNGRMNLIAVINLAVGALFCLIGALMIFGGGFMPTSNVATSGPPGWIIQAVGAGTVAVNALLFASGFGVRKAAPWGRRLVIACGALGVIVYAAALLAGGWDLLIFVVPLAYCFVLLSPGLIP